MNKLLLVLLIPCTIVFGQSKCYLEYHMTKGFAVQEYCYGSDTSKFLRTLSPRAHQYLDSIFTTLKIESNNVKCKKLTLKEGATEIINEKVKRTNYYFTAFERTFDCYDEWFSKNFKGRIKANEKTKILLDYQKSFRGDYEMLKIYILNKRFILF